MGACGKSDKEIQDEAIVRRALFRDDLDKILARYDRLIPLSQEFPKSGREALTWLENKVGKLVK